MKWIPSIPTQTYPDSVPTCVPARRMTFSDEPSGLTKMTQPSELRSAPAELGATKVVTRPQPTVAAAATPGAAPNRIATAQSATIE